MFGRTLILKASRERRWAGEEKAGFQKIGLRAKELPWSRQRNGQLRSRICRNHALNIPEFIVLTGHLVYPGNGNTGEGREGEVMGFLPSCEFSHCS